MKRREYKIYSDKIKDNINVAIVSDVHISENTKSEKIESMLETLNKINPTHILVPGDLYNVDGYTTYNLKDRYKLFKELTSIADVFYVMGNMEVSNGFLPFGFYQNTNSNFHFLCNKNLGNVSYYINGGVNIAGLGLPYEFYNLNEKEKVQELLDKYIKYLDEVSKKCGSEEFNILMCHDPIIVEIWKYYKDLNFDLIVSGHNHGGLFPKWMKPILFLVGADMEKAYPTYTKGMVQFDTDKNLIVSEGVSKFHSQSGRFERFEKYYEGTIENVKVLKK